MIRILSEARPKPRLAVLFDGDEGGKKSFEEGKVTKGVAEWAASAGQQLGKLEQPPSKLGIAREYIRLLEEAAPEKFTAQALQRPLKLVEWIKELLGVPEVLEPRKEVLRQPVD